MMTAWLDPAESLHRAQPLRGWSRLRQDAVRRRFAAMNDAWCADWIPAHAAARHEDAGGIVVEVVDAHHPDAVAPASDRTACWSFVTASVAGDARTAIDAIANTLFSTDGEPIALRCDAPVFATAVARTAWADWLHRIDVLLAGCAVAPQDAAPLTPLTSRHRAAQRWSGALGVSWAWCGGRWNLALPCAAVEALLGPDASPPGAPPQPAKPAPPERLDQVLGGRPAVLRVTLAGTELTLGQLGRLRPGDVVPLAHPLDRPVRVEAGDGAPVCQGWLGQSGGQVAVELATAAQAA